jgi:ABC-type transporter Mla MlaB component
MTDSSTPKDNSFLRKVARFVANPATDWADLNAPQDENRELELEKSELKAMIERKRRNDFVRRREFDMLRRVRREGLSPEQLAALGSSSRLDEDSDRGAETQPGHHGSGNVKAKIDAIEKQMVGGGTRPTPLNAPLPRDDATVSTSPAVMGRAMNHVQPPADIGDDEDLLPALPPLPADDDDAPPRAAPAHAGPAAPGAPARQGASATSASRASPASHASPAAAAVAKGAGLPPLTPGRQSRQMTFGESQPVEVGEVVHDPELDPAVIAFANADFDDCERMLIGLSKKGGLRGDHAETWLTLFDFYRATGQQNKFENLAMIYVEQFSSSAPQWLSLPKLVADAAAAEAPKRTARGRIDIGWVSPDALDSESVAKLASVTLQLPTPWVLDWTAVRQVDAQAAGELSTLFRQWGAQAVEMRWVHGERLLEVLHDQAPSGARDADPAFWMARLEALRLANRPDQFDETAIEYCITYEVSPPSWEPVKAIARMGNGDASTQSPSLLQITSTSLSTMHDSAAAHVSTDVASLELSGQLVGDIASTLQRLNDEIGDASIVKVSCARLIRVDFIAAGDLLNWVMSKRQQQRMITFTDAHRLVALFYGAMGISENASVRVRTN